MKDIIVREQKASNVINLILKILTFLLFSSCATKQYTFVDYELTKLKSVNNNKTQIIIKSFDNANKTTALNALLKLNGIYFFNENYFIVEPGKYSIESAYVGFKSTLIKNIIIKKGDSINLNIFMKEYHPLVE